jgi:dipeptidyl aminopeptidase/acylaminoacyl peptidase
MRKFLLIAALAASCLSASAWAGDAIAATPAPLIPRAALFGNPSQVAGQLSPDGKWLGWIAPRDGVLNVWVAPVDEPAKARALTTEKTRPIRAYFWAPDSSAVLFVNDQGGDENFLLYKVDLASGRQQALTPFRKTRVRIVGISPHVRDRILIGVNNRDPRWHDVYSVDLKSGKLTEVFENTGDYADFVADDSLTLRLAQKSRADGGSDFYRITHGKVEPRPFASIGLDDSLSTGPTGFTSDGKTLYWLDSRHRDTAALVAQDVASGKSTVLAQSPRADIGNVLRDPRSGKAQAYAEDYLKTEWHAIDPAIAGDLAFLQEQLKGTIEVTSRTDADDRWTVVSDPVTAPATTWLYERGAKKLVKLFVSRPELEHATLAPMYPERIRSRDGLVQVSYLTLPAGSDRVRAGRPDHPLPLVLFVHGGPWGRDSYGYSSYHQWLANRGYAVLSVNYRGSTGFGKKYISAGDLEWGRKMHDDLIDAVQWAVRNKITEPDKVAIMGGSYGGYATLVGLTFTPDTFACGVDIVGPSNLNTLLKTIPPYWEAIRQQFYKRMGDPTTEAGRALLHDRSPLFRAGAITRPLLIGQGANDPRVNQAESDAIVKAMDAKHIPVSYVLFPDEGHGFARPENSIAFNAVAEQFLGRCLDGRTEPIGDALKASSATVPHGREFVPGLEQALGAGN